MPRGDQTGPMGQGSGTGRKVGYCSGTGAPGFANAPGNGCGRSGRMGRGGMAIRGGRGGTWCRGQGGGFAPGNTPDADTSDRQDLLEQTRIMQAGLDALNERLARLEKSTGQE